MFKMWSSGVISSQSKDYQGHIWPLRGGQDLQMPVSPLVDPDTGSALITPTLGITIENPRPIFKWYPASDNAQVVSYTLIITGTSPFTGVVLSQEATAIVTTTQTVFTPTVDLPNAVYTWTVRAHDVAGNVSAFVPPQSFAIDVPIGGHLPKICLPLVLRS